MEMIIGPDETIEVYLKRKSKHTAIAKLIKGLAFSLVTGLVTYLSLNLIIHWVFALVVALLIGSWNSLDGFKDWLNWFQEMKKEAKRGYYPTVYV